jgi:TRAP-type C4-dicarboxylate transport system substrate-binding protein
LFTERLRAYIFKKNPNVRLLMVSNTGGWRCFVTKNKLVKTPADLKGMKIRTIESDLHVYLVRALGGTATPIPWAETYTSLKTGVAEGSMNGITDVINAKLHEVLKFITLDYHMYMSAFYFVNEKFYKSLPDDLKRIFLDGVYHMKWVSPAIM